MKMYEMVEVPATTVQKVVGCKCDRCGKALPAETIFQVRDFTLEFRQGIHYPECFNYKVWEVEDLCEDCVTFLHDLLQKNGFNINYREEEG